MRLVLALLAVLALIASPAIAAAKVDCGVAMQQAANGMDRPDMAGMDMPVVQDDAAAPCCDPSLKQKHDSKNCAQMCAAMAAVAVADAPMAFTKPLAFAPVIMTISARTAAAGFEPSGLKRPPKHIA